MWICHEKNLENAASMCGIMIMQLLVRFGLQVVVAAICFLGA